MTALPPAAPAPAPLEQVVYVSAATRPLARGELLALLAESRANNAAAEVTGMLLHVEGAFMQALEGPGPALDETMTRIRRDPRHDGVTLLAREAVAERGFADWSMALGDVSRAEARSTPGLSDFLAAVESAATPPADLARRLLASFRRSNHRYLVSA